MKSETGAGQTASINGMEMYSVLGPIFGEAKDYFVASAKFFLAGVWRNRQLR